MQAAARRAVLAGAGTLVGATLATLLLLRKPAHSVLTVLPPEPERLPGLEALVAALPRPAMPALGWRDAAGAAHRLAELSGSGVVLNIWATWCAPCAAEMPALAALAASVAGSGIVVLPLSIDRGGAAAVQAFYAAHGIVGLGVYADADGQVQRALGVDGVPTTFVIDRRGRRAAVLEGAADWGSPGAAAAVRSLVG